MTKTFNKVKCFKLHTKFDLDMIDELRTTAKIKGTTVSELVRGFIEKGMKEMETKEIEERFKDHSPWHPMTDSVDLKHLGKLMEELGECQAAIARCIIQGIDSAEPVTGKINKKMA